MSGWFYPVLVLIHDCHWLHAIVPSPGISRKQVMHYDVSCLDILHYSLPSELTTVRAAVYYRPGSPIEGESTGLCRDEEDRQVWRHRCSL